MKTDNRIFVFILVLSFMIMIPVGGIQNEVDNERTLYNGHLYQLIPIFKTWPEARDSCEARGGHLVTINDTNENDFVSYLAGWNTIWIGLTDERTEGSWQWVTNENVNYANWFSGEPTDFDDGEDYAEMLGDGSWNDVPNAHSEGKYYVCEWDDVDGEVTFNGHVYQVITSSKTWIEAKVDCEAQGGYLVTITNKEENDFLRNLIEPDTGWIGLTDERTEGDWQWVTGETVTYLNWDPGPEEPNGGTNENYAQMYGEGVWNDAPGEFETNYYVCEWGGSNYKSPYLSLIFLFWRIFLFIAILMILFIIIRRNR
ncbi:MAG: C-type lectin domain-containing protein [Candidatus Hodarchaeota archaeon]